VFHKTGALLFVGLLAIAGTLGLGGRAQPTLAQAGSRTFVGQVDGTDAFIAVVTDGTAVGAHVCDGDDNSIADYFYGSADPETNGGVSRLLTGDSMDVLTLNADLTSLPGIVASSGSLTGGFQTADGASHTWSADPASGPGALYHADQTLPDGTAAEGWWVVLNDGEVRGSFATASSSNPASQRTVGMSLVRGRPPQMTQSASVSPQVGAALLGQLQNARAPVARALSVSLSLGGDCPNGPCGGGCSNGPCTASLPVAPVGTTATLPQELAGAGDAAPNTRFLAALVAFGALLVGAGVGIIRRARARTMPS
jgi:hypothetical protein